MAKFCLTGTTGGLGSRVLHHLLHTLHVSPQDLIISLFNPSKAPENAKKLGVEVRKGDYTSPESLRASFDGAERLLLVSYPSIAHKIRVESHIKAINAARDVGVKHLYYTSLAFGDNSDAAVMQAHIDTEAYLKEVCSTSSMTYTVIKEGIYSESFPLYLNFQDLDASSSDRQALLPLNPAEGIAWVTRDDLGEATARIMNGDPSDPSWRNTKVLLSGPESWTFDKLASTVSDLLGWQEAGHPLRVKAIGEDAWIDHQVGLQSGSKGDQEERSRYNGEAREFARLWSKTYPAIEKGELAVVDPLCEKLLGRKPVTMDQYLRNFVKEKRDGKESIERYAK